jgi:hypothetical protein
VVRPGIVAIFPRVITERFASARVWLRGLGAQNYSGLWVASVLDCIVSYLDFQTRQPSILTCLPILAKSHTGAAATAASRPLFTLKASVGRD